MAPRASWKGFLTVGALSCAVGLHAAASTSERISLHMVSRRSGHRLRRQYADEETGEPVEADAQVRGYEIARGEHVTIAPEEAAAVLPGNDKTISIDAFLPCAGIDTVYLDRPYFLAPVDAPGAEVLDLLRRGMAAQKVAALGEALLFRRVRKLLIRPAGDGGALLASTLSFDYEVRPAEEAFADVPEVKVTGEMLDLATHIIRTKAGRFDPAAYPDRYETALAELVRAKMEGRPLPKAPPRKEEKVVDLLAALRASADGRGGEAGRRTAATRDGGRTGSPAATAKDSAKSSPKSSPRSSPRSSANSSLKSSAKPSPEPTAKSAAKSAGKTSGKSRGKSPGKSPDTSAAKPTAKPAAKAGAARTPSRKAG